VIVMLGNWSGPQFREICSERRNIGQLLSPVGWRQPQSRHWAADNDVYAHRDDPAWWCREGLPNWLKMLDKAADAWCDPMFCLLPDVVADWPRTLERAWEYRQECLNRDLSFAVALQDGCDFAQALELRPQYVFVGGTTAWKWRNVEPACQYFQRCGVKVHVGRASGPLRIRECLRLGVDSCDGTGWGRASDKMLPGLWRELDGTDPQLRIGI